MSEQIDTAAVEDAAPEVVETVSTPGSILRAAREERGMSVGEVAQVIRFSQRQIEALERDDYAQLPGATAVRGFMRSYAKLLRIDPAPLLASLDEAIPSPAADVRPPVNMGEAELVPLTERIPLRRILSVAVLLALAVFWFFTQPGDKPADSAATPPAAETVAAPAVVAPAPTLVEAAPAAPAANVAAPVAPAAAPVAPPAIAAAPVPFTGLRVEFDGRSWIEVRDATQKVVFVGEYSAGTKQNVDGKAPFQVWIGKASAVRVTFGERSIDLRPHTREEVARLTVE